jgi:hypothetical protein
VILDKSVPSSWTSSELRSRSMRRRWSASSSVGRGVALPQSEPLLACQALHWVEALGGPFAFLRPKCTFSWAILAFLSNGRFRYTTCGLTANTAPISAEWWRFQFWALSIETLCDNRR